MLIIRLTRRGKRNDPSFRIVVSERLNPIKGKFFEQLGHYNPKLKTKNLDKERILYWLRVGAACSPTVHNLLVGEGIIQAPKIKAWRPKKKEALSQVGPVNVKEATPPEEKTEEKTEPKSEGQEAKIEEQGKKK